MSDLHSKTVLPVRIRIGVTGHRVLPDDKVLRESIQNILTSQYLEAFDDHSRQTISSMGPAPVAVTIVSPLAEGADRLVARAALELADSRLEAVLPADIDDYTSHFTSPESIDDFLSLLNKAYNCVRLETRVGASMDENEPDDKERNGFYEIGRHVIERSDMLIALWDEKPARGIGGTAEIISLAIKRGMPVFIINTEKNSQIQLVNRGSITLDSLGRTP